MYVGANWGVFVWDDRIGLNINTGLDISFRLKAAFRYLKSKLDQKFLSGGIVKRINRPSISICNIYVKSAESDLSLQAVKQRKASRRRHSQENFKRE